jgi:hypothetical protein
VRRLAAFTLGAALLAAGCGVPQDPVQQEEMVASVAAEGALLAEGAAAGSTTGVFTREHATALRKLLGELRPAIDERRLARRADAVDAALADLAAAPGDRRRAARVERRLAGLAG